MVVFFYFITNRSVGIYSCFTSSFIRIFFDAALGRGKTSSGDTKLEAVSRLDEVGVAFSRKFAD